jgi:hypothetical protein
MLGVVGVPVQHRDQALQDLLDGLVEFVLAGVAAHDLLVNAGDLFDDLGHGRVGLRGDGERRASGRVGLARPS